MGIEISWRSQAGKRTEDNRDCAGVGIRGDEALCIVLDGSTAGPDSGTLARRVARDLIDWFTASDDAATTESLIARLRAIHAGSSGYRMRFSPFMRVTVSLAGGTSSTSSSGSAGPTRLQTPWAPMCQSRRLPVRRHAIG